MKVKLIGPIRAIHGALPGQKDTYFRVMYGEQILQHKPRTASDKQRAMRQAFGQRYAGNHTPKNHNPKLTTHNP